MNQIAKEVKQLKKEKNAIILAHYYASDEVQALADFVGDSFYLAKVAKNTNAEILVFCGVSFMGESAKILNPKKTVLMPSLLADCPMAHMVSIEKINDMRKQYDDLAVVCYINSSAELKCHSDVCVTSSNALSIVRALPNQNIFFIPDENLGRFVKQQVPEKNIILNDGYCHIHTSIKKEALLAEKKQHPLAPVLSHPECREDILALSDYIGSTADIITYAKNSAHTEFIICTEQGVSYQLKRENPNKAFYFVKNAPCCADMKLNTPERILDVLKTGKNRVELTEDILNKARLPLVKMLELAN